MRPASKTLSGIVLALLALGLLTAMSGRTLAHTLEAFLSPATLNFDAADTSVSPYAVDATNYLARFGISLSGVTAGTKVVIVNSQSSLYGGTAAQASSPPNVLTQGSSKDPVTFTLDFGAALDSVSFTRATLLAGPSGITHPEWSAHALNAAGAEVALDGESLISSYSNVPARTFTLTGPGITSLRFDSDSHHSAAFSAVLLDDLVLTPEIIVTITPTPTATATPAITPVPTPANPLELSPYKATGYRYKVIGSSTTPPAGFEQPGFDDSAWSTGDAAFGAGGIGNCTLEQTVRTSWPVDTRLVVRRVVTIPSGVTSVRVMVAIDNDIVGVYFNGTAISGAVSQSGCPALDEHRLDVPQSLIRSGSNLVAFHVRHYTGIASFFDTRILGEYTTISPTPTPTATPTAAATLTGTPTPTAAATPTNAVPTPSESSPPEDLARNSSKVGYPHPLESDNGWGGGRDKWGIVDGVRYYPAWDSGLAFTGGKQPYIEPCGWRQATINFGKPTTFDRVVVWHHGLEHVPNTYKIQYWNGTQWVDVFSTSNGRSYLKKFPTRSPRYWWEDWSTATENSFAPVTASKVRFALNNCDITHGWIYEFEAYYDGTSVTPTPTLTPTATATWTPTATPTPTPDGGPPSPPSVGTEVSYSRGWNIVAGPGGTVFSQANRMLYTSQGSGGYDVLINTQGVTEGWGYWANFPGDTTVIISQTGSTSYSTSLTAGQMKMVGNPSGTSSATVKADRIYIYDPKNGYAMSLGTATLPVGAGAWVYSAAGGTVTVTAQ